MAERPVEGNVEPRFFEAGGKQVAEKTSPGALERKKGFHGIRLFQLRRFCGVKVIIDIVYPGPYAKDLDMISN